VLSGRKTLKDINLCVTSSVAIAGSGSSSLVNVNIKELPTESGTIDIKGRVSNSS
jgi:hypothetical protein